MRKNICSLLLTIVMLISLVIMPVTQPFTVHAAMNQEQENGIKYVNKKLGFSLTLPKSWEGKYTTEEEDGLVRFIFMYEGKKMMLSLLCLLLNTIPRKKMDGTRG